MKSLKFGIPVIGIALAGLGVAMVVTNPGQSAYNDYATAQLTDYLKENACNKAPSVLGNFLQAQCAALLDDNQDQIEQFIAESTRRQNYLILSVYQTDLAISEFLPAYHFETVGVFQRFYTYKAERRSN